MIVYIVGKPRNRAELEAIFEHDQIIFIDSVDEYREHKLTGKKPELVIIDQPELPKPVVHASRISGPHRSKSTLLTDLLVGLATLNLHKIEARVLAVQGVMVSDDYTADPKTMIKDFPEPTITICTDKRRRSKGEKRRNRRHRWSGQ